MKQPLLKKENRDLLYFLFWPIYTLRYFLIENRNPAPAYTVIHCALDDWIPFQEGFLVFYALWYAFIVGTHLYLARYDRPAFRRYSRFLILSMSISTAVFLVFPSCQNLRPTVFPRDNFLTDCVRFLYSLDNSANVFPSEHVIGAVGVFLAALHCERLRSPGKLTAVGLLAFLISVSTVFLKQHSVLDGLAALPVCAVAYFFCYRVKRNRSEA